VDNWSLHHKGGKIEVGFWEQIDKYGNKYGGKEIRGPYQIVQNDRGVIFVMHGNIGWLLGFPRGNVYDTRRFAEGYELGPDWGNTDLLELRPRDNDTVLEIWKDLDRTDAVVEFHFTEYTLVREGATITKTTGSGDVEL
jgi:hypothetical protein